MNSIIKNIIFIILVVLVLVLIDSNITKQEFQGECNFTIGKTIKYSFSDGFKDCIEYRYYVQHIQFVGCVYLESRVVSPLNKFYKVKYSRDNPEISKLYLKEEINDSIKIIEAGFKFEKND